MEYNVGDTVVYQRGKNRLVVRVEEKVNNENYNNENYNVTIIESNIETRLTGHLYMFSMKEVYWSLLTTNSEIITKEIITQLDKLENKFINSQKHENIF